MTKHHDKTEAVANTAKGLGALVWWTLSGTGVTPTALRGILTSEGMDASIVPDVDPVGAIRRATREWSQGRGHADRFRAEVAAEANGTLTIGILTRTKPGAAEVRWMQVDTMFWDTAAVGWSSQPLTAEGVAFQRFADDARTHLDHAWITPCLIQSTLATLDATSLRARGGIYYVPSQNADALHRLARVVAKIGDSVLDINTVAADAHTQASIARAASASMSEDLAGLVTRINAWAESARKVSAASSASLLDELVALKNRADLYAEALNCGLGDLDVAIEAARVEAERVIGANVGTPSTPRAEGAAPRAPRADRVAAFVALFDVHAVDGVATLTPADLLAAGFSESLSKYAGAWTSKSHGGSALLANAGLHIVGMDTKEFVAEGGNKYRGLVSMQVARGDVPAPTDDTVDAPTDDTVIAVEPTPEPAGLALLDARQAPAKAPRKPRKTKAAPVAVEPEPVVDLGDVDATAAVDADVAAEADRDLSRGRIVTVTREDVNVADVREQLAGMTPAQVRERFMQVTGRSGKVSKTIMIDAIIETLSA